MQQRNVAQLINALELLAEHPQRFRSAVAAGEERAFFGGFAFALRFGLGLVDDMRRERELRHRAARLRGFAIDRHPHDQLNERGARPNDVLAELARLELAFIRLTEDESR